MRRWLWALGHAAWNLLALPWLVATRRGGLLLLTHWRDRDGEGRDVQMGPLVDALRARRTRVVEVALVPRSRALLAAILGKRRAFLTTLAIDGPAWIAARGGRDRLAHRARAARRLLRWLRPRALALIDESGSGQPWVIAARALGIRTIGIQHGDFLAGDPRYDARASRRPVEPVDVLCVWSPWFAQRLWARSLVYGPANTRVTGRMRYPLPQARPGGDRVRVLVLASSSGAQRELEPFLLALRTAPGLEVTVRPHPAEAVAKGGLARQLAACDVAVGLRSSALLEALAQRRPAVACGRETDEVLPACAAPTALPALCAELARGERAWVDRARSTVWEPAPPDAVPPILAELER